MARPSNKVLERIVVSALRSHRGRISTPLTPSLSRPRGRGSSETGVVGRGHGGLGCGR